ncbi:uncharacterized protein LOC143460873 isoform X1 [Clavelina lepadiformis]|uniref:uncharacterized protein LOC143460873 isoform X1 n=1 Tax=Clavelina lepadiformis TaxID=159417 RepID=UPI00404260EB
MASISGNQQSMRQSDSDELFVCPYDPVHRISAKRYVGHITKCKKNHPGADKDVCPFNARHIVPKPELQTHMNTCPDRLMFEFEINKERLSDDGDEVKGCTSLPPPLPSQDLDFGDDEDWDLEVSEEERQRRPNYRPNPTSTRWRMEVNVEEQELLATPSELRPSQTLQPFPMERRPLTEPQLRSGFVSMARGRNLNRPEQKPSKENSQLRSREPTTMPSLAANFSVEPTEPASRPSHQPKPLGRGRIPINVPRSVVNDVVVATREMDEERSRLLLEAETRVVSIADTDNQSSREEALAKEKRKLVKMIRQINKLDQESQSGVQLNVEQLMKLRKKPEIERRIAEINQQLKQEI